MTSTPNNFCQGKNKTGQPCRAYAGNGSEYCFVHDPKRAAETAAARRAGGRARHGRTLGGPGLKEPVILGSVGDACKLLEKTINEVRRLENSLGRARTVAGLITVFIRAFEVSELEARVSALEERLKNAGP
jgi:hypothetical protein